MTLEEFLFGGDSVPKVINSNTTNTRTYEVNNINSKILEKVDIENLTKELTNFNFEFAPLFEQNRESLYETFYTEKKGKNIPYVFKKIFEAQKKYVNCDSTEVCKTIGTKIREMLTQHPTDKSSDIEKEVMDFCVDYLKKQGFSITYKQLLSFVKDGYRRIDAPKYELSYALRQLKDIFEEKYNMLYHTSAFAYVKGRSTLDAVKRHQKNESKWFAKYDLSNFFGNTTVEFVVKMFSMIFPFSEIVKTDEGKNALETAISLCMLNGGLPQGTPISPMITNIMMIPVDFVLTKTLRDYNNAIRIAKLNNIVEKTVSNRKTKVLRSFRLVVLEYG